MEFLVDLFEVRIGHVSIHLGGTDVAVAEHTLDTAKIGTVHEEVGGVAMPHSVWADMFRNAGQAGILADQALDAAR